MSDISELLNIIPIGDIAQKLGVDQSTAEAAVKQVLPGLVGGLSANAADSSGEASLTKALTKHSSSPVINNGSVDLSAVDTADGQKIVKNVFGANTDAVASKLATGSTASSVTSDLIKQILPIVAPIVLSYIASQLFKPKTDSSTTAATAPATTGGGLGDILGGLLGNPQTQDVIGGLLGGLLGGGKK